MKTLAETIREITRKHLEENNGMLLGQCLTAVGFVCGTVPDIKSNNIIELPMSDVSNMGVACGAALAGRRPIIIIRFQDFMWLNSSMFVNYAAKAKEIFGTPVPVFVRALAQENAGCVHSGVFHSLFMHVPGIKVCAPMTPREYEQVWQEYMSGTDPFYVSEHRGSFADRNKAEHYFNRDADITLMPISASRFVMDEVDKKLTSLNITCSTLPICWLKPFKKRRTFLQCLHKSKYGLVIDSGHEICGASQSIAYELMKESGKKVFALGLDDRTNGVCPESHNQTPSVERIVYEIRKIIGK